MSNNNNNNYDEKLLISHHHQQQFDTKSTIRLTGEVFEIPELSDSNKMFISFRQSNNNDNRSTIKQHEQQQHYKICDNSQVSKLIMYGSNIRLSGTFRISRKNFVNIDTDR